MEFLIVLAIVLGLPTLLVTAMYNRLVGLRQNVRESWSAIDTELRRRFDLIPNLVEVVKGYASHERETLENVIKARNAAITQSNSPETAAKSNDILTGALRQIFALSEAYPQLKANENFQELQRQLEDTETRIAQARRFYNANVRELNTSVESFPTVLIAPSLGFRSEVYYGIEDSAAFEPVKIAGMLSSQPDKSDSQILKIPDTQKDKK